MNFKDAILKSNSLSDGIMAMNATVFGGSAHPNVVEYIRNQQPDQAYAKMGEGTITAIKKSVENFMGVEHRERLHQITSGGSTGIDNIGCLDDIVKIQTANPVMIRVIMANPEIRRAFDQGTIHGYSDIYDTADADVGICDSMYLGVVKDMLIVENGEYTLKHTWSNKTPRGHKKSSGHKDSDSDLLFGEKMDALKTWAVALDLIAQGGQDPTSPHGEML